MWAVLFVILIVIYRPIEQLLSRTIAERRARGLEGHPLRVPATIQASFALLFLVVALALRPQITDHLYDGSSALYWMTVVGVLAYAGSYFARGWLAGHQRFGLYGGLVLLESTSRFLFALAAAVGITQRAVGDRARHGRRAVRLAVVVPFAAASCAAGRSPTRHDAPVLDAGMEGPRTPRSRRPSPTCDRHGTRFAFAVSGIMLAEQTLMNAGGDDRRRLRRRGARRLRLQRAADHARAAAAVPGDPDLDAPPPRRPRGDATATRSSRARSASTVLAIAAFAASSRSACSRSGRG